MIILTFTFPLVILIFSELITTDMTGLIATSMNSFSYIATLGSVKKTLLTKDPASINIGVAICGACNSTAWLCYAFLIKDIFIFIPNFCGVMVAIILLSLYLWTLHIVDNEFPVIKILHYHMLDGGRKALPRKKKDKEEDDNSIEA